MRRIVAFWRCAAAVAVTLFCLVWVSLSVVLSRLARRSPRPAQRRILRLWSQWLLSILAVRVEADGPPPAGGCLFVSNHVTYLDIIVLGSILPGRFVAKHEVRSWPVLGLASRVVDVLFVDRSSRRDTHRVAREIADGLARGDCILLFPEGTSTHGHRVARFRPPLLGPAADGSLPVHYGALHYRTLEDDPPAHLVVCWWGNMPFAPHVWRLAQLRRIEAKVRFGERPLRDDDRKDLARRLQERVDSLFQPIVDFEPTETGYGDARTSEVPPAGDQPPRTDPS